MVLIALVAAYPIIYAIWLSLHEYSVRDGRALAVGRAVGLTTTRPRSQNTRVLGRAAAHVHLHRLSRDPRAAHRPRDGAGDARGVQGQGLLRTVVLVPWAVLTVVTAIMWRTIFERR